MELTPADVVLLALRAASFAAVLQAAGLPLFFALNGGRLRRSRRRVAAFGTRVTLAGIALTLAVELVQPAQLAGSFAGVLDPALHAMLLQSSAGAATTVRLAGLVFLLISFRSSGRVGTALGLCGATAAVASFALMGHTMSHEPRLALAALLCIHLAVIAFWFGALVPLSIVTATEEPFVAASIVARFTRWATWLVPTILVAGLLLAAFLLPGLASLGTPFGLALVAKVGGFAALLALGATNKWVLGPRLASGGQAAARALRRSLAVEWLVIVAVLIVTAILTGLLSPEA